MNAVERFKALEASLLPCPFCGSKAALEGYTDRYGRERLEPYCPNCGAVHEVPDYSVGEDFDFVELWNTRAHEKNNA